MSLAHLLLIAFQLAKDITHTPQLFQRFLKSSTSFTNQLSDSWSRTLETSSTSSVISNIQQGLSCCGFTSPLDRSVGSCGGGVSQEGHGQMIGMTGCKSVVEQSLFQTWLLMRFIIVGLRFFQVATYFGYYQLALEQIHASGEQHRDIDGVIYVSIFSTEVENESKFSLWFLPLIHLAHLRIHATHKYPVYMQESLGSYNNNDGMDEEPLPLYQKEGVNCRSPPEYLETIDIITSSPPSYTS